MEGCWFCCQGIWQQPPTEVTKSSSPLRRCLELADHLKDPGNHLFSNYTWADITCERRHEHNRRWQNSKPHFHSPFLLVCVFNKAHVLGWLSDVLCLHCAFWEARQSLRQQRLSLQSAMFPFVLAHPLLRADIWLILKRPGIHFSSSSKVLGASLRHSIVFTSYHGCLFSL